MPGGTPQEQTTPGSTLLGATSSAGAPLTSPLVAAPSAGAGSVAGFQATPAASISRLSVSPRAFRPLASDGARARHGATRAGAVVRFKDFQAATTTFSVISLGRASGGSPHACAGAARQRPCSAVVKVGSFVHRDRAGWNRLLFSGWVGARKLAPGAYRLVAAPKLAGQAGVGRAVDFQILA